MEADFYILLGVDSRAGSDAIRAAYRALARRYHPDVPGGSAERMIALNRAWSVLRDPASRAAYDRERTVAVVPPRGESSRPRRGSAAEARSTVLDYGRYEGWTIADVARHDPEFLEWLVRTPAGHRYQAEVARVLAARQPKSPAPAASPRRGWFRGR